MIHQSPGRWWIGPILVAGLLLVGAGNASSATFRYRPESNLKFHGVSTIQEWTCDTVPVQGSLELPFRIRTREDLLTRLEGFEPAGTLRIPVDEIDCGEAGVFDHNQNLYRTLRGSRYPYVIFDPDRVREIRWDTGIQGTILGELTLTDTTRRVAIPLRVDVADSRTLQVTGEFAVSLKDYGLSPPQLLFGLISIYDTVRITIDLRLYVDDLTPTRTEGTDPGAITDTSPGDPPPTDVRPEENDGPAGDS